MVLLGFAVRRAGVLPSAAAPLLVGAAAAFGALESPGHDMALFVFAGTWIALGMIVLRHRGGSVASPESWRMREQGRAGRA